MSTPAAETVLSGGSPLPSPEALRRSQPVPKRVADTVAAHRRAVSDVLHGRDDRRVVAIVGPCSIHDSAAALQYADRLAPLADQLSGSLVIVMRTYLEKPRSRAGWKGFVNDPHLDGSRDVRAGLALARHVLLGVGERGLGCGAELLDPLVAPFLEDLLCWAAVGARTAESQPHRELASRLALPVGFKNGMSGDVGVALDAMAAAQQPHHSLGIGRDGRARVMESAGNADVHLVLRGGGGVPNHDAESVTWSAARARREGPVRPVWIDCSHGNSGKDHRRQGPVFREVLEQIRCGQKAIGGVMLESHLVEGQQRWDPAVRPAPERSITDACIGWQETETLLREAAEAVSSSAR